MSNIPFSVIEWSKVLQAVHPGERGSSIWQVLQYPGLRVRLVEYSKDYIADHWCQKGHIVHCLEGELTTELENGDKWLLKAGMTYIVSEGMSSHRSIAVNKVKLLIIDGDFLKQD